MTRTIGHVSLASLVLTGGLACVLVDNPNYAGLDSETGVGTTTDSSGDSSSESTSDTTDSSTTADTTETTTDTTETTDGWCPPGQAGEVGCPCDGADLVCNAGLSCVEGVCSEPTNCPAEDPSVTVTLDPMSNEPTPATHSGLCELTLEIDAQGLVTGTLSSCLVGNVTKSGFSFGPVVVPMDDPNSLLGTTNANVQLWVVATDQMFMRIETDTFTIWLASGPSLDSSDPDLSDYPVALLPGGGDCPVLQEPCGISQRKAIQVDGLVFDGNVGDFGSVQLWVDEAKTICGADTYRFALLFFV